MQCQKRNGIDIATDSEYSLETDAWMYTGCWGYTAEKKKKSHESNGGRSAD